MILELLLEVILAIWPVMAAAALYYGMLFMALVMSGDARFALSRAKRRARKRKMIAERNAHLLQVAVDNHAIAVDNHAIAMKERRSRHLAQLNDFNEKAGFALECEIEPEPEHAPLTPSSDAAVKRLKMQERAYEKTIEKLNRELDYLIKQNSNYQRGQMAKSALLHYGTAESGPVCLNKKDARLFTNSTRSTNCPSCLVMLDRLRENRVIDW